MGGLLGVILALLGLSGAILVHKEAWISLPHAGDPLSSDVASVASATEKLMALPGDPQGIVYAGVHSILI